MEWIYNLVFICYLHDSDNSSIYLILPISHDAFVCSFVFLWIRTQITLSFVSERE